MNLRQDFTTKRATYVVIGILLTVFLYQSVVLAVNYTYNEDLSRFVTDTSCGPLHLEPGNEPGDECPGNQLCFTRFDADRVGPNITGNRCVKPGYKKYYCDFTEYASIQASYPPSMDTCYKASIEELPVTVLSAYLPLEVTDSISG